ncbi:hypothetical protein [uncultured Draconibacterium sp.]|uniref:hypothetical protein n=1 Tax=uncultured Draconibacterium sp. TaxID=1573823 RepID=UPI003216F63E
MAKNEHIEEAIQNVFYDIRAEAVLAELIENGMNQDDYVAVSKGIFKRRYARDIDAVEELKLENSQQLLAFQINRDGIYDSLPEGLFHRKSGNENSSNRKFSEDSVELKREEKEARTFFLPFENELFRHKVNLELEERKILSRFSEKIFNDIYPEFWSLHRTINRDYVYRMVLLLHFVHKITGNIALTARCLESIIEEKVEARLSRIRISHTDKDQKETNGKVVLGSAALGVDFICGDAIENDVVNLEFSIGPLQNTEAVDYLKMGSVQRFLDCFYSYFVPVEYEVKTKVVVSETKQNFLLESQLEGPVLGYETCL